ERDGNPLIYSLKGIFNYTITINELYKFKPSFLAILNKIRDKIVNQNIIFIAMPSSSTVPYLLARRVSRHFKSTLYNEIFIKCTVEEVINRYANSTVNKKENHIKLLNRTLSELQSLPPNTIFKMKHIPNKIRHYFSPWKIDPNFNIRKLNNYNIILIDDLLSTGTTLNMATIELNNLGFTCSTAICLLSNL
ncbi:TPA: phosphoribosyltransferase, partial [Proteus mirabilis]|nr:phosphoribosyltransferase [Proteus mirabilis]